MNIDLKTDFLRFLVPPSLFWSALILSNNIDHIFIRYNILSQDLWIFSLIFIATGFIISAMGALITYWIDEWKKPVWRTAEGEIKYWEQISCKGNYFSKKIEANWHFYYLNLNSVLALSLSLIVMFYKYWRNCELIKFVIVMIPMMLLMLLFISLAKKNYQRAKKFGDIISGEVVTK